MTQRLSADAVTLRYGERTISQGLSLAIPDGSFTVIAGPNACGKSTLLRALSRLLVPAAGQVILDGRHISQFPAKEVARRLGLLPQSAVAPEGITVADRSEEHTSELQSPCNLVCRLLLEKKKKQSTGRVPLCLTPLRPS